MTGGESHLLKNAHFYKLMFICHLWSWPIFTLSNSITFKIGQDILDLPCMSESEISSYFLSVSVREVYAPTSDSLRMRGVHVPSGNRCYNSLEFEIIGTPRNPLDPESEWGAPSIMENRKCTQFSFLYFYMYFWSVRTGIDRYCGYWTTVQGVGAPVQQGVVAPV